MDWSSVTGELIRFSRDMIVMLGRLARTTRAVLEVSSVLYQTRPLDGAIPTSGFVPLAPMNVFTVRDQTTVVLREVILSNTSGAAVDFSMSICPNGTTDAPEYRIYDLVSVPPATRVVYEHRTELDSLDQIFVFASATGLAARISGLEVTPL